MTEKQTVRPTMNRLIARMDSNDQYQDWWERHHRLASRLLAAPVGPVTPLDPLRAPLDGLCADDVGSDDPTWREPWHHSSWVLHYWRRVFLGGYWWRGPVEAPLDATCPLCEGLCRYQVTASEPTAPETSTCTYVPWPWLEETLKLLASESEGLPWSRKAGESAYDYLARSFKITKWTGLDVGSEPTAYLFRVADAKSKTVRHIVAHTPTPDATRFAVDGVFVTGLDALRFRMSSMGPTGMHEVSEEVADAHLRAIGLREKRVAQAVKRRTRSNVSSG